MNSMKISLILALLLFAIGTTDAQMQEVCFPVDTEPITVYSDKDTDSVKQILIQDFESEDHLYEVFILEETDSRFWIKYRDIEIYNDPFQIGWVDKRHCGVFARWYYDSDNRPYIKLYDTSDKSSYIKIYGQAWPCMYVISCKSDNDTIKVEFKTYGDDKSYSGWIDRYCPNIFNNCT